MSVLNKPYELSVWVDELNQFGVFEEKKLCIIGSNTMTSQSRALAPKLVSNVNGTNTLTFSIYYHYKDNITGESVDNPFIQYLTNERKIKLKYDNKWYDFIIKSVKVDSSKYSYEITATDQYINELSKNGFNFTFDAESNNNTGSVQTLAKRALAQTDWTVMEVPRTISEQFSEFIPDIVNESLVRLKVSTGFTAIQIIDEEHRLAPTFNNFNIEANTEIYGFYSSCTDRPQRFQFIYIPNSSDIIIDDNRVIKNDNCQYYIDNATYTQVTYNGYTFELPNEIEFAATQQNPQVILNYRGGRYVFSPDTFYHSVIGQYVNNYYKEITENFTSDENGNISIPQKAHKVLRVLKSNVEISYSIVDDNFISITEVNTQVQIVYRTDYFYGYTTTKYIPPNLIENWVTNPNSYKSTSGWNVSKINPNSSQGSIKNEAIRATGSTPPFTTIVDDLKGNIPISSNTYTSVLHFISGDVLTNTGFYSNRTSIGNLVNGKQYVIQIKTNIDLTDNDREHEEDKYRIQLGQYHYDATTNTYNLADTNNKTYFSVNDFNATTTPNQYYAIATVSNSTFTPNTYKVQAQGKVMLMFFNLPECYIEDFQIFEYIPKGSTYVRPEDPIEEAKIITTYHLYDQSVDDLSKTLDDFNPIYEGTEDPRSNNHGYCLATTCEKRRSVTAKESNYFNIIQTICENFECWAEFDVTHDSNGQVTGKFLYFHNYIGKDNYAGFRYGVNLKSIVRTDDSKQIVTKLIVKQNANEFGKNGFCTITRAPSNETGENYIYNVDHYINKGLLDINSWNNSIYDSTGAVGPDINPTAVTCNSNGYYVRLQSINVNLNKVNNDITNQTVTLAKAEADEKLYTEGLNKAQDAFEEACERFIKLTGYTFEEASKVDAEFLEKNISYLIACTENYQAIKDYTAKLATASYNLATLRIKYTNIVNEQNTYVNQKDTLNQAFYSKYYRYIQEGTWNSEEYYDDEKYYLDAVTTLFDSSKPAVSYTISVLELSQLEGYEDFTFALGDKTFIEDPDFFGYDINGNPIQEAVTLSEITYSLDEPEKNSIKIQTYKNSFQDLFKKISATVQSVQYSAGSYERGAQLAESTTTERSQFIQSALNDASTVLENLAEQSVRLDASGLTITDKLESNKQLRAVGGGILLTKDGGETWSIGVTAEGISASTISTGTLNTSYVNIMHGAEPSFRWDNYGLTAYDFNESNGTYTFDLKKGVRFDRLGVYGFKLKELPGANKAYYHKDSSTPIEELNPPADTWANLPETSSSGWHTVRNYYEDNCYSTSSDTDIIDWTLPRLIVNDENATDWHPNKVAEWTIDNQGNVVPKADHNQQNPNDVYVRNHSTFELTRDGFYLSLADATYHFGKNSSLIAREINPVNHVTRLAFGRVEDVLYNTWQIGGFPYYVTGSTYQDFIKVLSIKDNTDSEQLAIYDDGTIVAKRIKFTDSVEWTPSASPSQSVYAKVRLDCPANDTLYNTFPDTDDPNNARWHKNKNNNDIWYAHTDNAGRTWIGPATISGREIDTILTTYGISNAEDTEPSTWQDSIPTLSGNEGKYLWTRQQYQFLDGTFSTPMIVSKVLIAANGHDGVGAWTLQLSNETEAMPVNNSGHGSSSWEATFDAQVLYGGVVQSLSGWTFTETITPLNGINQKTKSTQNNKVSYVYDTLNVDTATVTISAQNTTLNIVLQTSFNAYKVYAGEPGETYTLQASPDQLNLRNDGTYDANSFYVYALFNDGIVRNNMPYPCQIRVFVNNTLVPSLTQSYIANVDISHTFTIAEIKTAVGSSNPFEALSFKLYVSYDSGNSYYGLPLDTDFIKLTKDGEDGAPGAPGPAGQDGNDVEIALIYYHTTSWTTVETILASSPPYTPSTPSSATLNTWVTERYSRSSFSPVPNTLFIISSEQQRHITHTGSSSTITITYTAPKLLSVEDSSAINSETLATYYSLTNGGNQGMYYDSEGNLYISSTLIDTQAIMVRNEDSIVFSADSNEDYVQIGGFAVTFPNNELLQSVYAQTSLLRPTDGSLYNSFPDNDSEQNPCWHKIKSVNDTWYAHTLNGGQTWIGPTEAPGLPRGALYTPKGWNEGEIDELPLEVYETGQTFTRRVFCFITQVANYNNLKAKPSLITDETTPNNNQISHSYCNKWIYLSNYTADSEPAHDTITIASGTGDYDVCWVYSCFETTTSLNGDITHEYSTPVLLYSFQNSNSSLIKSQYKIVLSTSHTTRMYFGASGSETWISPLEVNHYVKIMYWDGSSWTQKNITGITRDLNNRPIFTVAGEGGAQYTLKIKDESNLLTDWYWGSNITNGMCEMTWDSSQYYLPWEFEFAEDIASFNYTLYDNQNNEIDSSIFTMQVKKSNANMPVGPIQFKDSSNASYKGGVGILTIGTPSNPGYQSFSIDGWPATMSTNSTTASLWEYIFSNNNETLHDSTQEYIYTVNLSNPVFDFDSFGNILDYSVTARYVDIPYYTCDYYRALGIPYVYKFYIVANDSSNWPTKPGAINWLKKMLCQKGLYLGTEPISQFFNNNQPIYVAGETSDWLFVLGNNFGIDLNGRVVSKEGTFTDAVIQGMLSGENITVDTLSPWTTNKTDNDITITCEITDTSWGKTTPSSGYYGVTFSYRLTALSTQTIYLQQDIYATFTVYKKNQPNTYKQKTIRIPSGTLCDGTIFKVGINTEADGWEMDSNRYGISKAIKWTDAAATTDHNFNFTQTIYSATGIKVNGDLIPLKTNTYNLGNESYKWDKIYTHTGIINTSDRNQKENIQSLSTIYNNLFDSLNPVLFNFKDDKDKKLHLGFIAQEVANSLQTISLTPNSFGGYYHTTENSDEFYGLIYSEFIALNTWQIQQLKARVLELEAKVNELTNKI